MHVWLYGDPGYSGVYGSMSIYTDKDYAHLSYISLTMFNGSFLNGAYVVVQSTESCNHNSYWYCHGTQLVVFVILKY